MLNGQSKTCRGERAAKNDSLEAMRQKVQIGSYDAGKSVSYYGELLRAFLHLNMMIPIAAEDWFSRIKENGTSASVGKFPPRSF